MDTQADGASVPVGEPAPGPVGVGPGLAAGMGEEGLVQQLNAWGAALELRSQRAEFEIQNLKVNLGATQEKVADTFIQARDTLWRIVGDFNLETERLRGQGQAEAAHSLGRLELIVTEARERFAAMDARFGEGLTEISSRLQAVDAWAREEPDRVSAIIQAAPAPPMTRSPGGTPVTYFPAGPGLRPTPVAAPPGLAAARCAAAGASGLGARNADAGGPGRCLGELPRRRPKAAAVRGAHPSAGQGRLSGTPEGTED